MTLLVGCAPKEAHMDPTTVGESISTGADTTDTPTGDSTAGETGEQTSALVVWVQEG